MTTITGFNRHGVDQATQTGPELSERKSYGEFLGTERPFDGAKRVSFNTPICHLTERDDGICEITARTISVETEFYILNIDPDSIVFEPISATRLTIKAIDLTVIKGNIQNTSGISEKTINQAIKIIKSRRSKL